MIVISNGQIPIEIIIQGGAITALLLILSLSMACLISNSKYWNKWISSTLYICISSLIVTFAAIVVFRIMLVLKVISQM
ncbi:hypothetical protein METP1_00212 [Methanosarcinales archaeon]|nr:hypothetical protein METP1_00212 [Methanosarcinales archaeon]